MKYPNPLIAATALVISTQSATATILMFDDFENGNLSNGGTVGSGFQLLSNDTNGTGTVGESGGNATIATAANSFDNSGIVNINSFSTSGATSIIATWVVSSQTGPGATNGVEHALQGGTSNGTGNGSGFRTPPNIRFIITNNNEWTLSVNDGTNNGNLSTGNSLGAGATISDGYSFTLTLDAAGWAVSGSGFGTNPSASGAWTVSGFDFSDLQTDLYASSIIQANNNNVSRTMDIDSITVSVPEPSSSALLLGGLGMLALIRRKA